MYKVDLHTHSVDSPDGGIKKAQYRKALNEGLIDFVAITDHNQIQFAIEMNSEFPDRVIIGEEIMTTEGEIIGLYLKQPILANLTPVETIDLIKRQGGLVYIPHPLEKVRSGLGINIMEKLSSQIDIVEVGNGRAILQHKYTQMAVWSNLNHISTAASSDAHGFHGLGMTYTLVQDLPTRESLKELLLKGYPKISRPNFRGLLYPKYNRVKKRYSKEFG